MESPGLLQSSRNEQYTLPNVLLWAAFLLDAFLWQDILFGFDLRGVYVVIFISMLLMLLSGRLRVFREVYIVIFGLLVWSAPSLLEDSSALVIVFVQLVAGLIFGVFVSYLITSVGSLDALADVYLRISIVLAVSVIGEQLVYLLFGLDAVKLIFSFLPSRQFEGYLEGGVYRASGLFYEPSQAGLILAPAVCMALWLGKRFVVALGAIAIILSFSTLGLVGLAFALIFGSKMRSVKLVLAIFSIVIGVYLSIYFEPVRARIGALSEIAADLDGSSQLSAEAISLRGGTVASLVANTAIVLQGAHDAPIFGFGLGAFRVHYNDMIETVLPGAAGLPGFYNPGGASLLLRMIFELGVVGTILVVVAYFYRLGNVTAWRGAQQLRTNVGWVLAASCFFALSVLRKDLFVSFYFWFFLVAFMVATRLPQTTRAST